MAKVVIAKLKSISPYSQSKHYVLDKKSGESAGDFEKRTWRERLHVNEEGFVFIPPMALKNCLSEAAKYMSIKIPGKGKATFTKHFEAGVLVVDPIVLPVRKEDVDGEWFFIPSDGKRGGGSRVDKCMPKIPKWEGSAQFHILDNEVLNSIPAPEGMEPICPTASGEMTAFEFHLRQAGGFIGIGRFRPRNNGFYGRFTVEAITIS